MKKIISISVVLVFLGQLIHAQTSFWNENFGTSTSCAASQGTAANGVVTPNGTWAVTSSVGGVTDAAQPNTWYISSTEAGLPVGTCGNGCATNGAVNNNTLHVGTFPSAGGNCPTGDCGAAYDAGGLCGFLACVTTSDRAESPVINCTGMSTITLGFSYLEAGDPGHDFMQVMYSANGGTTWSSIATPGGTGSSCGVNQALWTNFAVALPATANNNPNVKIGFWWQNNDDGTGTTPSIAIDSIQLTTCITPTVSVTSATICAGATTTLTASGATSYAWSTSDNSTSISVTPTSTASYTVTGGTGTCTNSAVANVTVNDVPVISSQSGSVKACGDVNGTFSVSSTGTYTYTWYWNDIGSAVDPGSSHLDNGTYNETGYTTNSLTIPNLYNEGWDGFFVFCVVTNSVNCSAISKPDTITVYTLPTVDITASSTTICVGTTTTLTASGATTYTWSTAETMASISPSPTVNTTYSVTGTDDNGCINSNTATLDITVNDVPVISSQSGNVYVCGDNMNESFTVNSPGSNTYQWYWSGGALVTTNGNPDVGTYGETNYDTDNMTILVAEAYWGPSGTQGVYCVVTNSLNCIATTTFDTIFFNPLPTLTITASSNTLCASGTATLTASGATSYTWTSGPASNTNTVSPILSTQYTVTGTDANGCMNMDTLTVMVNNCTTGINNLANNNQITVYPNPNNGSFVVTTTQNANTIIVTDILGNELLAITPTSTVTTINLNAQANGIYFVKIISGNAQTVKRVVINN